MTPELAQKWIDELPKHKKGNEELRSADGSMCCLGVIAHMHGDLGYGHEFKHSDCHAYFDDMEYGLSDEDQTKLYMANDSSSSWQPVQDLIRKLYIDGKETS